MTQRGAGNRGLRPQIFLERAADGAVMERPCRSDAEILEAADQQWAWMHDRQPPLPVARYLRKARDLRPAPQPAAIHWEIDWEKWGDVTTPGWAQLTLWERWLAWAFLRADSPELPETKRRWAAAGSPLTEAEQEWFFAAPARSAPDPLSRFKLRACAWLPRRLRSLATQVAAHATHHGLAPPSLTTSVTGHLPKQEGGTRPIGLMNEFLKRTEGLAARQMTEAAATAPHSQQA